MRAIDADRLKKSFEANTPIAFQDCVPGIHAIIDLEPTVEAVPVIRCKDCKYLPLTPRLYADDDPVEFYILCGNLGDDGYISQFFHLS